MNDQNRIGTKEQVDAYLTKGQPVVQSPKGYIAQADQMLGQCRDQLIKAESLHLAKRSSEMLAFKDRLLLLDAQHAKLVEDLTAMIEKLEVFRA